VREVLGAARGLLDANEVVDRRDAHPQLADLQLVCGLDQVRVAPGALGGEPDVQPAETRRQGEASERAEAATVPRRRRRVTCVERGWTERCLELVQRDARRSRFPRSVEGQTSMSTVPRGEPSSRSATPPIRTSSTPLRTSVSRMPVGRKGGGRWERGTTSRRGPPRLPPAAGARNARGEELAFRLERRQPLL
jgi:hypothetical protein